MREPASELVRLRGALQSLATSNSQILDVLSSTARELLDRPYSIGSHTSNCVCTHERTRWASAVLQTALCDPVLDKIKHAKRFKTRLVRQAVRVLSGFYEEPLLMYNDERSQLLKLIWVLVSAGSKHDLYN